MNNQSKEMNWTKFEDGKDAVIALQGSLITELQEQIEILKKLLDEKK